MIVAIDRRTHDSDVMERVLGIDNNQESGDVRVEVIDLAVQPWLAGTSISAIQLTIGGVKPRRPTPKHRR